MPESSGSLYFLVIDQGTSSTKCFLFDKNNDVVFSNRIKHQLSRLESRHVECDANLIAESCVELIEQCVDFVSQKSKKIYSVGIAIQRSTFLFWDKITATPLTPALSWQDSRAGQVVEELSDRNQFIHEISGVPLSAHFGGPKYQHLINNDSVLKSLVEKGAVWFGPLSAFIAHKLTGNPFVDHTVAGRSQLMNIADLTWDDALCTLFNVKQSSLPSIVPTMGLFGQIKPWGLPLNCVIGDQQSALIGQGGIAAGSLALNFGTSASVLLHSGNTPNHNDGLLNNVLFSNGSEIHYLTEGSINTCNSLFYWLENELKIPHNEMQWDKRCAKTRVDGVLIPGFAGLAAPYWKSGFNSVYYNLENANADEIIRAGMESIGFLVYDIMATMPLPKPVDLIPASGGGARPPLLQFIADLTGIAIGYTIMKDRTAFGVYSLLKKYTGNPFTQSLPEYDMVINPKMDSAARQNKLDSWQVALKKIGLA